MPIYTIKPFIPSSNEPTTAALSALSVDLSELNAKQARAVTFRDGPLLVIAGAGSGKTRTLIYRLGYLISQGVLPHQILLLTFTKKAAEEMVRRASGLMDQRCAQVFAGTFHSFGNHILRQFGELVGFHSQFTILDRGDAEDLIGMIRKHSVPTLTDKRFPKKGTLADIFSKSLNTGLTIQHILTAEYPQFLSDTETIERIQLAYHQQKKTSQVMDYDDLLIYLLQLLSQHPEIQRQLSDRYRYIMVDEFQDTNHIQAQIVYLLAQPHQNVMAVGDDSQCIYSFRGADFKNIMSFPTLFKGAEVITLEQNYRSQQPILDLTNALIAGADEKFSKRLFTQNQGGAKPVFIETQSNHEQSMFICQKILELRDEGIDLNRIAVLFRAGFHSNDLEIELGARNIPYLKFGGFKFIESSHIKDVLAFLKIILNPTDVVSWQRVLQLIEGIGAKTASDIIAICQNAKGRVSGVDLGRYQGKAFYSLLISLFQMMAAFDPVQARPADVLDGIRRFYQPLFKARYDNFHKRSQDIDSLLTISERFESIAAFLAEMSLAPPDMSQVGVSPTIESETSLTLSTIHSAKGLEWHTVFIISVIDGLLPSFQSIDDHASLEEERRLLYVAMTRAERQLFIIKPNMDATQSGHFYRYSGFHFSRLSRFLEADNLVEKYMENWILDVEDGEDGDSALLSDGEDSDDQDTRRLPAYRF